MRAPGNRKTGGDNSIGAVIGDWNQKSQIWNFKIQDLRSEI